MSTEGIQINGRDASGNILNKRQRRLLLYLYYNPSKNRKFDIYIELNWPNLTVTRIGYCLIRKGFIKKVSEEPPAYALTRKSKDYVQALRGAF